jgi:hypothetical protein
MYQDIAYDTKSTEDMILEKINYDTESDREEPNYKSTISKQENISIKNNEQICKIGTCCKIFKNKKRFDKHITTHFYETVYKCEYEDCLKVYRSKENLTLHIKNIYFKIKPYSCSFCHRAFSHRNGKIYHERRLHRDRMSLECLSIILLK